MARAVCDLFFINIIIILLLNINVVFSQLGGGGIPCVDDFGKPQKCIPPFENAAYNAQVDTTNTCGANGPIEFCVQSGTQLTYKTCDICYPDSHPPSYLIDYGKTTWWQSETMFEDIQYPQQVNITLKFGRPYDITFVRLLFWSPRPESFAIYKKLYEHSPWTPYQFYSGSCPETYGLPDDNSAKANDSDSRIFCTSEYSDISPLTGGNVPFATLEGRPRAIFFDANSNLQEFVTATEILISLDRLNTFGDEVFGDPQVLKSYFYAIADLSVGARCKCNGHASQCLNQASPDGYYRKICICEHNTAGPDCNECDPFYNDAPWSRATSTDPHVCRACNCNGFSNRCYFDKELYNRTGHGGHCLDCQGYRDGPNCEKCRDNFYQRMGDIYCTPCDCNPTGSWNLQCNSEGKCQCKPGVTGEKCDRCDANHYDFGEHGCKKCDCNPAGSLKNTPKCDTLTGVCECKDNIEGTQCQKCKPGYFNLDTENDFGCTPCFCYGHSSVCQSAPGYSKVLIESMFARGTERWSAVDAHGRLVSPQYNTFSQSLELQSQGPSALYFSAPDRFLGDQRFSYNHDLIFKLRIAENGPPNPDVMDVTLEGAGLSMTQAIFGQENPAPNTQNQEFVFRLHENPDYGWQPRLSARDFISTLANLTAIKIRGTYNPNGIGFLDDVKLETARRGAAGSSATWIEMCTCPQGYVGQFCESCAPGYRHEPTSGGPYSPCVPCNCNGHADICDAETGRCICTDNTGGDNCERCARGYYGNSLEGTTSDCKVCPCPNQGPCIQLADDQIVCLECPRGYGGPRCDLCSDGYYGDPSGKLVCLPCDCNNNVDPNAIGNCNRTTGECLKCIYNTGGAQCDVCLPGFYGDALALPKGDCELCQCYPPGTLEVPDSYAPRCDQLSGQCSCKPHVVGRNCDQCEIGYFNIRTGEGCQSCNCDPIGSFNSTCDPYTGQCLCREGVTGTRCELCKPLHYGYSLDGCKPCQCDPIGSVTLQCDASGQCPCLDNVEGRTCDRCKENKHNRQRGCEECPACYNLVQDAVNAHRSNLNELQTVLKDIANSPTVIDDADFEKKLSDVQTRVEKLWHDAQAATSGGDKSLSEGIADLRSRINAINQTMNEYKKWSDAASGAIDDTRNITLVENTLQSALEELQEKFDYIKSDGASALEKARKKSDLFGQQSEQMSNLAKDARRLAEIQKMDADRIDKIAVQAVNVSSSAYNLAKDAISMQKNITDDLRMLDSDLETTSQKLEVALGGAQDVKQRVDLAHKEALAVYTDIFALSVPDINLDLIKQDAQATAKEAGRIKELAENLLKNREGDLKTLDELLKSSDELLARGAAQQNIAAELLQDAEGALNKSDEAVKLGDKTLEEAQQTYATLKEFDKQVQESKDKASTALESIPAITALIDEAKTKTENAKVNLAGAENNAQLARNTAQKAQQQYAEQASKEAKEIRKSSDETKQEAKVLKEETNNLVTKVDDTETKLSALEKQASQDQGLTNQAKKKIGQAKTSASEASKQVQKALEEVNKIVKELNDLPDIDDETLNQLEARLREAENEFYKANLDEQLETLTKARLQQFQLVKNYQEELGRLESDVKNVEAIRDSLPDGCWKRTRLEP